MNRTLIILSNFKYHKWILVNESKEEILQQLENVQLGNGKVIIANQHCAATYTEFKNLAEWDSESAITINPEHWALINITDYNNVEECDDYLNLINLTNELSKGVKQ